MQILIDSFDKQFSLVHSRSVDLVGRIPQEKLFWKPRDLKRSMAMFSCGENILRSAAAVEQTFGGITTRLWDDPFEWTLPEKLSTPALVLEYLEEVEETRIRGFAFFGSDEDLGKELLAPRDLKTVFELLLETIARAEHYQGRAFSIFQMFSNDKLPRV